MFRRLLILTAFVASAVFLAIPGESQEKKKAGKGQQPILSLNDRGHTAAVRKVLFTGKGKLISASEDRTIRVWDVKTGDLLQVIRPPVGSNRTGEWHSLALHPDGDLLAVAGIGNTADKGKTWTTPVFLISLKDGEIAQRWEIPWGKIIALSFSADGKRLALGYGQKVEVLDATTGTRIKLLEGHGELVFDAVFHPKDSNLLLSASQNQARIWNLAGGDPAILKRDHKGFQFKLTAIAWRSDGKQVAGASDQHIYFWTDKGKDNGSIWTQYHYHFGGIAYTPDLKTLIWSAEDPWRRVVNQTDLGSKEILRGLAAANPPYPKTPGGAVAVSANGKVVAVADDENHAIYLWSLDNNRPPRILGGSVRTIRRIGWEWAKENRADPALLYRTGLVDNRKEPPVKELFDHCFFLGSLTPGPLPGKFPGRESHTSKTINLKWLHWNRIDIESPPGTKTFQMVTPEEKNFDDFSLVGDRPLFSWPGLLAQFNTKGEMVRRYTKIGIHAHMIVPAPPNLAKSKKQYFAALGDDHIVRIYDVDESSPLLYFTAAGPQWIVWTNEGYYAASAFGERLMGWHANQGTKKLAKFYPASEFRASLYRPDVIRLVLQAGSVKEALAQADRERGKASELFANIEDVLPPEVRLLSPGIVDVPDGKPVQVQVRAEAKAVGKHGVTALRLLVDGRPYAGGLKSYKNGRADKFEETWTIALDAGTHEIAVQAESAVSKAVARGIKRVEVDEVKKASKTQLHVLTVGVSAYNDSSLTLNFAHRDAEKLAEALGNLAPKMYQNTVVKTLTDKKATRDAFFRELEELRTRMTAKDVAVISFAGHGERDDKGNFYLLPVDTNPNKLAGTCIPGDRFREAVAKIPGRIVVMLDACHSGAAKAPKASRVASSSDDLVRELVSEECSVTVMCSSTGAEYSLESPTVKHGYFTLALLDGLSGKADYNDDGFITMKELDLYVTNRVEELSKDRQHPVSELPPLVRSFQLVKSK